MQNNPSQAPQHLIAREGSERAGEHMRISGSALQSNYRLPGPSLHFQYHAGPSLTSAQQPVATVHSFTHPAPYNTQGEYDLQSLLAGAQGLPSPLRVPVGSGHQHQPVTNPNTPSLFQGGPQQPIPQQILDGTSQHQVQGLLTSLQFVSQFQTDASQSSPSVEQAQMHRPVAGGQLLPPILQPTVQHQAQTQAMQNPNNQWAQQLRHSQIQQHQVQQQQQYQAQQRLQQQRLPQHQAQQQQSQQQQHAQQQQQRQQPVHTPSAPAPQSQPHPPAEPHPALLPVRDALASMWGLINAAQVCAVADVRARMGESNVAAQAAAKEEGRKIGISQTVMNLQAMVDKIRSDHNRLEEKNAQLERENAELKSENDMLRTEREASRTELDAFREGRALGQALSGNGGSSVLAAVELTLRARGAQVEAARRELDATRADLETKKATILALTNKLEAARKDVEIGHAIMRTAEHLKLEAERASFAALFIQPGSPVPAPTDRGALAVEIILEEIARWRSEKERNEARRIKVVIQTQEVLQQLVGVVKRKETLRVAAKNLPGQSTSSAEANTEDQADQHKKLAWARYLRMQSNLKAGQAVDVPVQDFQHNAANSVSVPNDWGSTRDTAIDIDADENAVEENDGPGQEKTNNNYNDMDLEYVLGQTLEKGNAEQSIDENTPNISQGSRDTSSSVAASPTLATLDPSAPPLSTSTTQLMPPPNSIPDPMPANPERNHPPVQQQHQRRASSPHVLRDAPALARLSSSTSFPESDFEGLTVNLKRNRAEYEAEGDSMGEFDQDCVRSKRRASNVHGDEDELEVDVKREYDEEESMYMEAEEDNKEYLAVKQECLDEDNGNQEQRGVRTPELQAYIEDIKFEPDFNSPPALTSRQPASSSSKSSGARKPTPPFVRQASLLALNNPSNVLAAQVAISHLALPSGRSAPAVDGGSVRTPAPAPKRENKLGINHHDILYKTEKDTGTLVCRMCTTRRSQRASSTSSTTSSDAGGQKHRSLPVQRFPQSASWDELVGHCRREHPKACEDLEKMSPAQVAEMKQHLGVRFGR